MFARGPQAVLPALRCCHLGLSVRELLRNHVNSPLKRGFTEGSVHLCFFDKVPAALSQVNWFTQCRSHRQEGQVLGCEPSCCQVHLQIQRNPFILWMQIQFCLRNEKVSLIPAEDCCHQGLGGAGAAWLSAKTHSGSEPWNVTGIHCLTQLSGIEKSVFDNSGGLFKS